VPSFQYSALPTKVERLGLCGEIYAPGVRKASGRSPACLAVEAGRLLRWAVA